MILLILVYYLYYYFVLRKCIENLLILTIYNLKFLHSPKRLRNIQLFQRGSKKICFRKIQSHNIVLIIFYLLCNIFLIFFNCAS